MQVVLLVRETGEHERNAETHRPPCALNLIYVFNEKGTFTLLTHVQFTYYALFQEKNNNVHYH